MDVKYSPALKLFKKEAGNVNHMLITIYVGLDGIIPNDLSPNPNLHTTWNPQSKPASVERSKIFARKAAMVWLVDCLDMYLRLINRSPMLFLPEELKRSIDGEEVSRSVYKRIGFINTKYNVSTVNSAFVDLLICWRNRATHYGADNNISETNRQLLMMNREFIKADFCGLDIGEMLSSFESSEIPSFKEVTALVRATTNYVYEVDRILLDRLDLVSYADRVLMSYLREKAASSERNTNPRIDNIFSKDISSRKRMLQQILMQNGFTTSISPNAVDDFCENVSKLNYQKIAGLLEAGSLVEDSYT